jgi:hypothetical protein
MKIVVFTYLLSTALAGNIVEELTAAGELDTFILPVFYSLMMSILPFP